ncbi:MAG: response regulator transcription factor [Gemmatimonas sp.]
MRVLIAEDDRRLSTTIARGLRNRAYAVDVVTDGGAALTEGLVVPYDVIVLDVMLPVKTGLEVASALRARGIVTPILMLTARDAIADRVAGLDAGADDYLIKPFALEELLARLRALLRRGPQLSHVVLRVRDLEIDTRVQKVVRAGREIPLTSKEYALLEYLARNQGGVITRGEISVHVWDDNHDPLSNNIDVLVTRLRRKIDDGFPEQLLHTRRGAGYMLAANQSDA